MSDRLTSPAQNRLFVPRETEGFVVHDFDSPGRILDIDGGGEGIIGRLKGCQSSPLTPTEPYWKKHPTTHTRRQTCHVVSRTCWKEGER